MGAFNSKTLLAKAGLATVVAVTVVAALGGISDSQTSRMLQSSQLSEIDQSWILWKKTHQKGYAVSADESYRKAMFTDNFNYVKEFNAKSRELDGDHEDTHILALNEFADMSNAEFRAQMAGYKGKAKQDRVKYLSAVGTPDSIDWRAEGAVTQVKNQGQCGSCWSFSSTGAMEGAWQIKTGKLIPLSEQQLVDCSGSFGNQGCNGGLMNNGFRYAERNPLNTEAEYPYTARDGICAFKKTADSVLVKSHFDVPKNDPVQFAHALNKSPVAIAVDASSLNWQLYSGGIIKYFCGTRLDHGVLAVGYGTSSGWLGGDYWIVKNSWGPSWGERGYLKISRNMDKNDAGVCGILSSASYPTMPAD